MRQVVALEVGVQARLGAAEVGDAGVGRRARAGEDDDLLDCEGAEDGRLVRSVQARPQGRGRSAGRTASAADHLGDALERPLLLRLERPLKLLVLSSKEAPWQGQSLYSVQAGVDAGADAPNSAPMLTHGRARAARRAWPQATAACPGSTSVSAPRCLRGEHAEPGGQRVWQEGRSAKGRTWEAAHLERRCRRGTGDGHVRSEERRDLRRARRVGKVLERPRPRTQEAADVPGRRRRLAARSRRRTARPRPLAALRGRKTGRVVSADRWGAV